MTVQGDPEEWQPLSWNCPVCDQPCEPPDCIAVGNFVYHARHVPPL